MPQFYPDTVKRISTRRLLAVILLVVAAISYIVYSWINNDPRWENYLVSALFIFLILSFSIADSFWPVVTINDRGVTRHKSLWLPKNIPRAEIAKMSCENQNLYVTTKSQEVHSLDLRKLAECDLNAIRLLTQESMRENAR